MEVWGRRISNPIGLSAGFDKNVEAVEGLLGKGFGFVEIGSSDEVPHGGKAGPDILDVNLGKNKTSEDAAADYVEGVHTSSQYAYYLVINISSPDTPGLCKLQGKEQLKDFVEKVALTLRLDGLIVTNSTIARPDPASENPDYPVCEETGDLCGKPLYIPSTNVLSYLCLLTRGKVPLYGCGGISKHQAIDMFPYYNKLKHEQHYQYHPCDCLSGSACSRPCNCPSGSACSCNLLDGART
ncbi:hypothetical protein MKW92_041588 [Papaver armeniacum]|nr:hypothetical protein MKW92_041588 [Papaver armeniacum]